MFFHEDAQALVCRSGPAGYNCVLRFEHFKEDVRLNGLTETSVRFEPSMSDQLPRRCELHLCLVEDRHVTLVIVGLTFAADDENPLFADCAATVSNPDARSESEILTSCQWAVIESNSQLLGTRPISNS